MFSLCHCHIDHHALIHNLHQLGDIAGLMPVIKSNAYGHGMVPVARSLHAHGAQIFAVGTVDEALCLRREGLPQDIVVLLGAASPEAMKAAVSQNIMPLVHSVDSLKRAAACASPQKPVRVVVKQDSGMTRLGFRLEELPALRELLHSLPQVDVCILLSHLACADMPEKHDSVSSQAAHFQHMFTALRQDFPHIKACLNNTAGILGFPQLACDLSRPGIALYGYNPFISKPQNQAADSTVPPATPALWPDLRPVMSVSTRILQIRAVPAGTPVSYGESYITPAPTRVAVLGIGYADGYSRGLSSQNLGQGQGQNLGQGQHCRGQVVIAGQRVPVLGRVCMGMCMVDVGSIPPQELHEGDLAWLLGGPYPQALNAQELADIWGTIPYEVLCLLGSNSHIHERV